MKRRRYSLVAFGATFAILITFIFLRNVLMALAAPGYKLPWPAGVTWTVTQGWGGSTHTCPGQMCKAYDFDLSEGAEVRASLGGAVAFSEGRYTQCGDYKLRNEGNRVTIYHDDGRATLYLHLKQTDVFANNVVQQGARIGLSGKTGWTNTGSGCVPHLHFQRQLQGNWITQSQEVFYDEYPDQQLNSGRFVTSTNSGPTPIPTPTPEPTTIRQIKFIDNLWPWSWKWQIGTDDSRVTKANLDGQLFFESPGCTWGTKWLSPGRHTLEYWYLRDGGGVPTISTQAWPYVKAACAADDGGNPAGDPRGSHDSATFIADLTLPDGTSVSPGQSLIKTWRVRNTGTSTWDGYQLIFLQGDQMGGTSPVNIPTTAPNQEVDISVSLQAPTTTVNKATCFNTIVKH